MTRYPRLVVTSHVEAGKTAQFSIARVLWELGKNPNLRIVILSNTGDQAKKIVRTVGQYIKKSRELRQVFPELQPHPDIEQPWTSTSLVVNRGIISKDPSVQAIGFGGAIMGSRIDLLLLDDLLDYENTRTPHQMDGVYNWLRASALGRLTQNSRVWGVTNSWHPKDPMERLAAQPGYKHLRTPVVDEVTGELSWPARWPMSRIKKARRDLGPLEFGRQLMCQARDDEQARFHRAWIDVGLDRGRGYRFVQDISASELPDGYAIFTGCDLAVQEHSAADLTVFFTILLWPTGERQVINIEAGRWNGPEIVKRVDNIGNRYGGIIVVENVGAQDYILQFSRVMTRSTVRPFTTGRNKANPAFGVESLAAELEAGRWVIPNAYSSRRLHPEVSAWVNDMLFYNPKEHTGDRLMASWFAREGARAFERSQGRTFQNPEPQDADDVGAAGIRVLGGS
jgi:hypothetical protein